MKKLTAILIIMLTFAMLPFACTPKPEPEPITGGTTDQTDPNAPKTIESKEIERFEATFCLAGEWSEGRTDQFYTFTVENNRKGAMVAAEKVTGANTFASDAFLTQLQNIIDAYRLVENNGVYRVTAGLAPEYQECSVYVEYISGEKLTFTVNNDPDAEWAKAVYLLFADLFAREGNAALEPPRYTGEVVDLHLVLKENGKTIEYKTDASEDKSGEQIAQYRYDDQGGFVRKAKPVPADYREMLTELVGNFDLRAFDPSSALYGWGRSKSTDTGDGSFRLLLYIDYADGYFIQIDTTEKSDYELLRPLVEDLLNYYEMIF